MDMKNVINYYYGLIVREHKKKDNKFIFEINNNIFEFIPFFGDVNTLINIYSILKMYRRDHDEIILNKDNNVVTFYNNESYILLKKYNNNKKNIDMNDIINYDSLIHVKHNVNLKKMWSDKVDYYLIELKDNNNLQNIKGCFSYYVGLSELAINLLNYVDFSKINYYISHRRVEESEELYNPLNIIIDSRVRDIAEYIKNSFFYNEFEIEKFEYLLKTQNFTQEEIILLLARLIYPSYFFDAYEKVYFGIITDKEIEKIIKKYNNYKKLLKKIYNYISFLYNIPKIDFFEN